MMEEKTPFNATVAKGVVDMRSGSSGLTMGEIGFLFLFHEGRPWLKMRGAGRSNTIPCARKLEHRLECQARDPNACA